MKLFHCLMAVLFVLPEIGHCARGCLEHPWYKQAPVERHWSLLEHRVDQRFYRVLADRDKAAKATEKLKAAPAVKVSRLEAMALVDELPETNSKSRLFLIRGIKYPTTNGDIFVYSFKSAVMVGFAYMGQAESVPAMEAPLIISLPRLPSAVYIGCSGVT